MKIATTELVLERWPYGLEVRWSRDGLLLKPRRKARAGWTKGFRTSRRFSDDLAPIQEVPNQFDREEWEW